jgi:hypothetical protein
MTNSPPGQMNPSLLEEYIGYHPEFMDSLTIFKEDTAKKILKRLKSENDRNNFISTVAEIRFGKLFSELGFEVEYDKKFPNNQRPDWLIKLRDSTAICDVYRLGKSDKDQVRSDFQGKLMEKLEEIPKSYFIKINFIDEYFDSNKYNVDQISNEVRDWLDSTRIVGESISVADNFEFEIRKTNTNSKHVCCVGNASSIDIKPQKVNQIENLSPNEITKKLNKYDKIISEYSMPYFICVYIDFVSGFDHGDLRERFLGHGVEFIDFGTPIANLEQFRHMGQTWTELGEFYNNLQLSGILTFYNEQFKLLLNPNKQQVIYSTKHSQLLRGLIDLSIDENKAG